MPVDMDNSDTSDTSSLLTLSNSLRKCLYRYEGERRVQASNDDYGECRLSTSIAPPLGPRSSTLSFR